MDYPHYTDVDGWGAYAFNPEASTVAKITVPTQGYAVCGRKLLHFI
ncbi:MAG: hypothetical protein HC912_04305 [Saprospiraceae bacterium]|nr:hypothetical protein [Saprospiraceae bacterium]